MRYTNFMKESFSYNPGDDSLVEEPQPKKGFTIDVDYPDSDDEWGGDDSDDFGSAFGGEWDYDWDNIDWDKAQFGPTKQGNESVSTKPEVAQKPEYIFFNPDVEPDGNIRKRFMQYLSENSIETDKTDDAIELCIRLCSQLGMNSGRSFDMMKKLARADMDSVNKIFNSFGYFNSRFAEVNQDSFDMHHSFPKNAMIAFINHWDNDFDANDMAKRFMDGIIEISNAPQEEYHNPSSYFDEALEFASQSGDPDVFSGYIDIVKDLIGRPENLINGAKYHRKTDLLRLYGKHGFDMQKLVVFRDRVFPMIDQNDPRVESLMKASNSFGTSPDTFGISDFTLHSLVLGASPRNIRDLMQIYREIPTSDFARFEQNRNDAAALMGCLWSGRDFIHDERPGIHELLEAMVAYYDTKDDSEANAAARERLQAIVNDRKENGNYYLYGGFDGELCMDLSNYDRTIVRSINYGVESQYDQPAIDVLRRLEQNTRQASLEKPKCGIEDVDTMIEGLKVVDFGNGEVGVEFNDVAKIIERFNDFLAEHQGEACLDPKIIQSLSYMERMATYAMRGISKKDYTELAFDPGFKEICRFSELTSGNDSYSKAGFEQFWNSFVSDFSKDWPNNIGSKYQPLVSRTRNRVRKLAESYKSQGAPRFMIDSLWSGNLNHELVGLTDER